MQPKEDPDAQIKYLECVGQYAGCPLEYCNFVPMGLVSAWMPKISVGEKAKQINPYAAAHPERLFDLDAKDRGELRRPQLPRKLAE